jgi:hypothetical protein
MRLSIALADVENALISFRALAEGLRSSAG